MHRIATAAFARLVPSPLRRFSIDRVALGSRLRPSLPSSSFNHSRTFIQETSKRHKSFTFAMYRGSATPTRACLQTSTLARRHTVCVCVKEREKECVCVREHSAGWHRSIDPRVRRRIACDTNVMQMCKEQQHVALLAIGEVTRAAAALRRVRGGCKVEDTTQPGEAGPSQMLCKCVM